MTVENEAKSVQTKSFEGEIEYEMSQTMAKQLLATRKGADSRLSPQAFLCNVVNSEFRLKGFCTKVLLR